MRKDQVRARELRKQLSVVSQNPWLDELRYVGKMVRDTVEHAPRANSKYTSVDSFLDAAQAYFHKSVKEDRHLSVHGLRLHLGLSPSALSYYAKRGALWQEAVEYCQTVIKYYGQQKALTSIGQIAFADIRKVFDSKGNLRPIQKIDDDTAAAISSVDVVVGYKTEDGMRLPERTEKVRMWDKGAAQERWCKLYDLFPNENKVVMANDGDKPFRVEGFSPATELFFSRIARLAAGEPTHVVMELTDGTGTE